MTTVTRRLATFASDLDFQQLPADVVAIAKVALLNIVAAAIGGAQTRIGRIHTTLAKQLGGGRRESSIVGDGERVSVPAAAYANGSLAFALDYEDVCEYVIHAGPIVVPAVLAVGEARRVSGKAALTALVAGYEVGTRIGQSMQPSPERGAQVWGQQYTPFAACAAAGNLLGLTAVEMDVAFGVTGTYATVPSAYKYFGIVAETRPMREAKLGWGWMSMAGTMGALSAQAGLRGGHGMLDGKEGFWIMAGSDQCDVATMTKGLGSEWKILRTDFKLHPSIAWSHPAHVALSRLMRTHAIKPAQIERARVWNVGVPRIADYAPQGAVDAQFSLPYAVATTLLGERLTPALYSEEKLGSAAVRAMLARIDCIEDGEMDLDWFKRNVMRTRVEIELKDGRKLEQAVTFPIDKPKVGRAEVIGKLEAMADGLLPASRVQTIAAAVDEVEGLKNLATLAALLSPGARTASSKLRSDGKPKTKTKAKAKAKTRAMSPRARAKRRAARGRSRR
jgi:2-methylcitrate dehydratase PrpD